MLLKLLERSGLTATQQGSALVLTVHGFDEEMKVEDISRMPCKEFAELYTAYARKQAKCLLDIEGNTDSGNPALARLQLWNCMHCVCPSPLAVQRHMGSCI